MIYVSLLGEGVECRRPVCAEHLGGNVYQVLDQPYDRNTERWEFEPGCRVVCEHATTSEGQVLAAIQLADCDG